MSEGETLKSVSGSEKMFKSTDESSYNDIGDKNKTFDNDVEIINETRLKLMPTDGNGEEEDEEDDDPRVPIDRGWAWVVVLGTFFTYFFHASDFFTCSVLFLDLIEYFHTTATALTTVLSVSNVLYSIAFKALYIDFLRFIPLGSASFTMCISVVTAHLAVNLLMPVMSVRVLATVSAILFCTSTMCIAAIPNILVFAAMMILKAIAQGGALVPAMTLVSYYFKRKRALAIAVCLLGVSVASMVIPPLARYLRDEFGMRGGFLLMAGFEMHAISAALLLRPLSWYKRRKHWMIRKRNVKDESLPNMAGAAMTTESSAVQEVQILTQKATRSESSPRADLPQNGSSSVPVDESTSTDSERHQSPNIRIQTFPSAASQGESPAKSDLEARRASFPHDCEQDSASYLDCTLHEDEARVQRKLSNNATQKQDAHRYFCSSDKRNQYYVRPKATHRRILQQLKRIASSSIDIPLVKNYLAIFHLVAFTLAASSTYVSVYLPSHAVEMGISKPKAALLLTVVGGVDIFTRVAFGYFVDLGHVRPSRILACSTLIMALLCHLSRFYTSFTALVFVSIIYGAIAFLPQGLNAPFIVDLLGVERLGKMLAFTAIVTSVSAIIQYPIHGALVEGTGSFVPVLHFVGTSFILGAFILSLEPVVRRLQDRRERRQKKDMKY